jgi:[acyl-carrier-protein] S-malonyltransferase
MVRSCLSSWPFSAPGRAASTPPCSTSSRTARRPSPSSPQLLPCWGGIPAPSKEAAPADLFSDLSGQILCCTQALAAWASLGTVRSARAVIAGYSIGELAAWGCAGAFDELSILRLAQRRATVMDAAAPNDSGLAVITGLRRPVIEPILARHALSIAIVNDVDSFTVGGPRTPLRAACEEAAARGAKRTVTLPVTVPSHTPLLSEATEQFRVTLREASPRLPRAGYRLLSGIDGETVLDIETGIDKLTRQISTTIDWPLASRVADQRAPWRLWNWVPEPR